MKVHTSTAQQSGARSYVNPRKTRRLTARERRGLEMVKGCRVAERPEGERWTR